MAVEKFLIKEDKVTRELTITVGLSLRKDREPKEQYTMENLELDLGSLGYDIECIVQPFKNILMNISEHRCSGTAVLKLVEKKKETSKRKKLVSSSSSDSSGEKKETQKTKEKITKE